MSDNASTDETARLLREFSDHRVRVIRQKTNIGMIANWNACLAAAKGDYILFLPDDDRIPPWMLERFIEIARTEPRIAIVIGQSEFFFTDKSTTWHPPLNAGLAAGVCDGVDVLEEWLKGQLSLTMCSIMMRTEVLRAVGGFATDAPWAADMLAFSQILMTNRAGFINTSCGTFTVHPESMTSRLTVEESLSNWQALPDRVAAMADRFVTDLPRRRDISLEVNRFFARHAIDFICKYRKAGGKFVAIAPLIWQYRHYLRQLGITNAFNLTRPIAIILLPRSMTKCIRYFKRTWGDNAGRGPNR